MTSALVNLKWESTRELLNSRCFSAVNIMTRWEYRFYALTGFIVLCLFNAMANSCCLYPKFAVKQLVMNLNCSIYRVWDDAEDNVNCSFTLKQRTIESGFGGDRDDLLNLDHRTSVSICSLESIYWVVDAVRKIASSDSFRFIEFNPCTTSMLHEDHREARILAKTEFSRDEYGNLAIWILDDMVKVPNSNRVLLPSRLIW